MEKGRESPPEERAASITTYFDDESKKISDRMKKVRARTDGVYTNGTINRRRQEVLHLEQRHAELINDRTAVLQMLSERPTQTYGIRIFFERKLDEIDLEIEARKSHSHRVILEKGTVIGVPQQLSHLATMRTDMFRIGNHVLGLLGEHLLTDKKDSATNSYSLTN